MYVWLLMSMLLVVLRMNAFGLVAGADAGARSLVL